MRSASRQSLTAAIEQVNSLKPKASTADELLNVARLLDSSTQLRSALADATAPHEEKTGLVTRVFGDELGADSAKIVAVLVAGRWSQSRDLVEGLEETALRCLAIDAAEPGRIESELFALFDAVSSHPELELALRSKMADPQAKQKLVGALLEAKSSEAAMTIAKHLVAMPRGRRLRDGLRRAARIIADQAGAIVATITTASELSGPQRTELTESLSQRYDRKIVLNTRVDASVLGGVRIEIGDEVIDGSISARLNDVHQRLAGADR